MDERTNTYEFKVLYNHKTHSIDKVIALVMNGSVRIKMNQKVKALILDQLSIDHSSDQIELEL